MEENGKPSHQLENCLIFGKENGKFGASID
jgi:hypothetical protein